MPNLKTILFFTLSLIFLLGCDSRENQALLAQLAQESKDSNVRQEAVKKIKSSTLLFKIANEDININVREEAVKKLRDQKLLQQLSLTATDYYVRTLAIQKIRNQQLLKKIVLEDYDFFVRQAAVEQIKDQSFLIKTALEDESDLVRITARNKIKPKSLPNQQDIWLFPDSTKEISDENLLTKIAIEAKNLDVRITAVENINNASLLTEIITKTSLLQIDEVDSNKLNRQEVLKLITLERQVEDNLEISKLVVSKIDDQDLLGKIVYEVINPTVSEMAVKKINNQRILSKIAVDKTNSIVGIAAITKLTDQGTLARIAFSNNSENASLAAIKNLSNQGFLCEIAKQHYRSEVGRQAVMKITNQEKLAEIILRARDFYYAVPRIALNNLTEEKLLTQIALDLYFREYDSFDALGKIIEKITNPNFLSEIALEHKYKSKYFNKSLIKINNSNLIAKIILQTEQFNIEDGVLDILDDQIVIEKIAYQTRDGTTRSRAIKKIKNQATLYKIVMNDYSYSGTSGACDAVSVITDQSMLYDIALRARSENVRGKAISKMEDQGIIVKIIMSLRDNQWSSSRRLVYKAIDALTDEKCLGYVSMKGKTTESRCRAVKKIKNEELLTKIISQTTDPNVKETAKERVRFLQNFGEQ